jgi:hypothetical protein
MLMLTDFSIFQDESIDSYTEVFTDYLKFCLEVCCPISVYHISPTKLSSPRLKFLRRKKEKFYKLHDFQSVKHYSELIRDEIANLNGTLLGDTFKSRNPSDIWGMMKRITGRSETRSVEDVNIDELNKSFIHNPLSVQETFDISDDNTITFTPVSVATVSKILSGIRRNSSSGADGLPPLVIKECAQFVAPTITDIMNKSLSTGKLPSIWKTVRITPIPKTTNSTSVSNFRPIASSSVLLKIAENILLTNILPQLTVSADSFQFAYKKSRSTTDAIATLYHTITANIDAGAKFFQCAFLDFSSAFNTICRRKIIEKLQELGAPSWCLKWLCDYFSDRLQYISANGKKSSPNLNCHGVLQGAVLSPFLFNLYTDAIQSTRVSIFIKYADDFALGSRYRTAEDANQLQDELTTVLNWSAENDLRMNSEKCNLCVFSPNRHQLQTSERIFLGVHELKQTHQVKYLGVLFSSNLTWSLQIESLYTKCLKLSFYIRRLRGAGLPNNIIRTFVHLCIVPIIIYASPVIFPGLLSKDVVILKRALRLVSNSSSIPYVELCHTIIDQHAKACTKFCDRILNDSQHPLYQFLNSTRSFRNTRRDFVFIFSRTACHKRSCLPFLSRFLTNKEAEIEKLTLTLLA